LLKAPTWMPSGSNGFSSGSGRRNGGVVAMVAMSPSGVGGGAPARLRIRIRGTSGADVCCSRFGDGGVSALGRASGVGAASALGGRSALRVASGLAVASFGRGDRSVGPPGFAGWPDLRLRALGEGKAGAPAPKAGR